MKKQSRDQLQTALWAVGVSLVLAFGAQAQKTTDDERVALFGSTDGLPLKARQVEKRETTGSFLARQQESAIAPLQIITRQELKMRGHTRVTEAVQSLSSVFNGLDLTQSGMNRGGVTSAAVHGMPAGTLVLLNGQRLASHGLNTLTGTTPSAVDLSLLPLSAVERIEVLGEGASSVYGAQASAGVINIITRAQGKGLELSVDQIRPQGGAGQGWTSSLNWARGQLRQDGYSLRLTAEADTYKAMGVRERTTASQGRQMFSHEGVAYQADSPRLSAFGSPLLMYSPTGQQKMYSPLYVNGTCTAGSFKYEGFEGGCKNNRLLTYDIYPQTDSQKLHVLGEVLLPHAATLYAEVLASQQNLQIAANDWSGVSGKIADTIGAPGYLEAVLNGLNAEETYTFWQPDLPALRQKYKKTLLRASLGLKGEFKGWHYQASLLQSQSKATQSVEKDNLASLGLVDGLSSLPNALMLKPLDAQNPLTAQLLNSREWGQAALASTALTSAQLRASRALFEHQGQSTLWAWGLEAQQEKADTQYSQAMAQPSFKGQRHIMSAFSELQVPVRKNLDLLASLRADQYSDVGAAISSKLAARWAINRRWAMRGSAGTGFQAPTLAQVHQLSNPFLQATVQLGDCTEALKAAASALKAADGQAVACTSNSALNVFTNGNPDLQLQKTKQVTWGMAFTPSRNVHVSADYWRVQMQDTLQLDSVQAVLADPLRNTSALMANPDLVSLDGGGKVHNLALLLKMKNKGQAVKEGIDIQARYREPMRDGRWVMGMQATFMLKSKDRTSAETAWVSDLGAYSALSEVVTPRWRSQWMVGYEQAQMQWQFNINHTSAYVDKEVVALNTVTGLSETVSGHKVRGFLTADLLAVYQASRRTQIRFGMTNLANSKPPLSFYSLSNAVWGVNSQNGNLQGRTLRVGATMRF